MVRNLAQYPVTAEEKRDALQTVLNDHNALHFQGIGSVTRAALQAVLNDIHDEDQETINAWGRATFDDNSDAMQCASRMNVEVAELLQECAGDDPSLNALLAENARMAEAINTRVHQLPANRRCSPKPGAATECADVLIVLFQVADRVGTRLRAMVDKKMVVNRARSWAKTSGGRYQHT